MSVILEALKKSQHQRPPRGAVPALPRRRRTPMLGSPRSLAVAASAAGVTFALVIAVLLRPASQPAGPDRQVATVAVAGVPGPATATPVDEPIPAGPASPIRAQSPAAASGVPPASASNALEPTPRSGRQPLSSDASVASRELAPPAREPFAPSPGAPRPGQAMAPVQPRTPPAAVGPPGSAAAALALAPQVRPLSTQRPARVAIPGNYAADSAQQAPYPMVTPLNEIQSGAPAEPSHPGLGALESAAAYAVPRLDELPPSFRRQLPPLKLDVHSFDVDDSRRFVLINLTKLHEGDQLAPATSVVSIVSDGVVLDHEGTQFLLPAGH